MVWPRARFPPYCLAGRSAARTRRKARRGAPLQLTGADLQNRVAEPGQERRALLLLPFPLLRLYQQLDDQRTLRAHVRDDERTDLAVGAEAMGMQRRRLQQAAQPIVSGEHERRLMLRGREKGAINYVKKAEIESKIRPEEWRESAPVAARRRRPQPAHRRFARDVCADAAMPGATLDAARIVCPLHGINDRVETRSDQVAQMPSPTVFALHVSLRLHTSTVQRSPAKSSSCSYAL